MSGEIMKTNYHLICGLEVHAELKTNSKMFCGCKNDPFGADKPNIYTCPVCLGMPGGLPVANKKAIEWTIQLGLALNCKINLFSKFDRKNYFYPDLPKGYQISQYDIPFCEGGYIDTSEGRIGITRIHLEEDTGKLLHKTIKLDSGSESGMTDNKVSLIDFNRGGVPLIEIVTEPDIKTPSQAAEYGRKLRQIMRYLEIANCDMEQGGMRLEANISLQKSDWNPDQVRDDNLPNYKVEVKNINSFKFMQQAIEFEMERQAKILDNGEIPTQETRGYNPNTSKTFSQRTKEDAEDYRYFPDPDLPPIRFTKEQIEKFKSQLPVLPDQLADKWSDEFAIDQQYLDQIITNKTEVSWWQDLFALAKTEKIKPNDLVKAYVNKNLSINFKQNPDLVIKAYLEVNKTDNLDIDQLQQIIDQVITDNPKEVSAYKDGKTALINFFVGQVMRLLKKKVDVGQVKAELEKTLS